MEKREIAREIEHLDHLLALRGLRAERVSGSTPGETGMLVKVITGKALTDEASSEELAAAAQLWTLLHDLQEEDITPEAFLAFGGDIWRNVVKQKLTEAQGYRVDPVDFVDDDGHKTRDGYQVVELDADGSVCGVASGTLHASQEAAEQELSGIAAEFWPRITTEEEYLAAGREWDAAMSFSEGVDDPAIRKRADQRCIAIERAMEACPFEYDEAASRFVAKTEMPTT